MTTFYELLKEQLILRQRAKYENWEKIPEWFINDYLESLAKDLIRRFDEENSKSS